MPAWLGVTFFLLYLAGVGAFAHLWPYLVRQFPLAALAIEIRPAAVCLWMAALTVAWPGVALYGLVSYLAHQASK
ncbi:hypothetical protein [Streptomyces ipomoeae]|uniref:hypothetical protein n=1 Tax=Streptomyces ipomoeae TaxID=103232 RepID=UPI0011476ACC|nr:hypothetical protein [Streptomyces ipomoeae]TQE33145.1 hypothetical protein Sipo7851_21880 [Streptomyces ipomoeae]